MARLRHRFPIYSWLIQLYPGPYRDTYGTQMLQTLADMLDGAGSPQEQLAIRLQAAIDLPLSLTRQNIRYIGGVMVHDMPTYIKHNALIGGLLLTPFVLALFANTMDYILTGHDLYASWVWHAPFQAFWVLWLPLIAAILAFATLVTFIWQHRQQGRLFRNLMAVQHLWPVLGVGLIGLGIVVMVFTHDSVHCVLGNPVSKIQHLPQTWRCVRRDSATYPFQHPTEFLRREVLGRG